MSGIETFIQRRSDKELVSATVLEGMTRNRGQSPRDSVSECLLFSVADGRFDREIERVERFCPVVKAHFAALSVIHRGWRFD